MPLPQHTAAGPPPALLSLANALPNVFWSALSLGPLAAYCYQFVARPWLYGGLAACLLGYGVPTAWFGYWQLSRTPGMYRKLGVTAVNRVTQNGAVVHWLIRRWYPRYRQVPSRAALAGLVRTTYQQERFHVGLFLFFLLISAYAVGHRQPGWAGLLTLTNAGYNVYPVWLQQYIRVRLGQYH